MTAKKYLSNRKITDIVVKSNNGYRYLSDIINDYANIKLKEELEIINTELGDNMNPSACTVIYKHLIKIP